MRFRPVVLLTLFVLTPLAALAQTAATSTVSGTVTDQNGAVVQGATVNMTDLGTNAARTAQTSGEGQYVFVNVVPGNYKITVTAKGFKQAMVSNIKVDVTKAYNINLTLTVGGAQEVVEIAAGAGVEMQTSDATVGNELKGEQLVRLPNATRSAIAFYTLQPLSMPYRGAGVNDNSGGQVAGARTDQNTFILDGADITDNTVGTHPVKPGGIGAEPTIPVPIDSVEEVRVGTTNPNATFGRSSGGQIAFVTKRGANDVHGAAYWYHQNDNLNANTWDRNRLARKPDGSSTVPEPELKDNRFGGALGGPIWRDHTFLFGNYEGRRFPREVDVLRLVRSSALRQGVLRFRDVEGNVVSYDLKTSRLCGPNGDQLCDPRSVGLSPVIKSVWDLLPPGNDPVAGDGLNTIGFRSTASQATNSDFAVGRLDHKFAEKWSFDGSYRWFRQQAFSPTQLDIAGLLPGSTKGKATSVAASPVRAAFYVGALTGQITPTLINETRVSFVRDWWWLTRADPSPQVSGTNVALQIAGASLQGGLLDQPIDVHTQLARTQGVNDKIFQIIDNLTWVKGGHTMQFGGSFRRLHLFHQRNVMVVGSPSALVAEVADQGAITINPANRPRECGGAVTTDCLQAGDVTRWNRLYAGALGMVDNIGVMIARDGDLKPKPIGTALEVDALIRAHEYYFNDTWRLRSNLTFTLGLSYQWQTPPKELEGRQTFLIDQQTKKIITSGDYLAQRRQAAEAGDIFNPSIAFQTIKDSGRDGIFDIDRKNIGPRLSFAWTPDFSKGFLERLTGGGKTVVRGGYGIVFDRLNTVQTVVIPLLGVGFAQTINCFGPRSDRTCQSSSDPTNAFRIGVDGLAPIPTIPPATSPVVPSSPFGELLSFQVDPDITVGRSHSVDFTIQRELRGGFMVEAGYTGRFGRNLNQNLQINAVPYFMKDKTSSQTFAQAFDAVATQVRAKATVTPQPWFENQLKGSPICAPNCTAAVAAAQTAAFQDGLLNDLWTFLQFVRPGGSITNLQVLDNWVRTDGGRSNYNAFF